MLAIGVPLAVVAQAWALPAAFGQETPTSDPLAPVVRPQLEGLDIDSELLETEWVDPFTQFELEALPLASVPEFDFSTLHDSVIFEDGVANLSVRGEIDIDEETERHLRSLQAVATAELALSAVDDDIEAARGQIARGRRNITSADQEIVALEREIARAEAQIADIIAADDSEITELARLDDEILQLNAAIAELAIQAFTGEDNALESVIEDPGSTEIVERRVLTDELREFQRADIEELLQLIDEAQARRDQLASDLAPVAAANELRTNEIDDIEDEIDAIIEFRASLQEDISDLEVRRVEIDATIEETVAFAEITAAQYNEAYHQRLDLTVTGTNIPLVALNAYVRAERTLAVENPSCGIHWSQLAGIGRTESSHGTFDGSALDINGNTTKEIIGVALDGGTFGGASLARILDTDNGALDGDREFDRAVGPMQFIPSTWALYQPDGNGDGESDPQNIYDAALGSARLLCDAPGTLLTESGEQRAYFAYNQDLEYSATVTRSGRSYYDNLRVAPESSRFAAFSLLPTFEERIAAEEAARVAAAEAEAAAAVAACQAEQNAIAEALAAEAAAAEAAAAETDDAAGPAEDTAEDEAPNADAAPAAPETEPAPAPDTPPAEEGDGEPVDCALVGEALLAELLGPDEDEEAGEEEDEQ